MQLIVDIRSHHPTDTMMTHYASEWVDLWLARHPTDRVSYLHFESQTCPKNGISVIVPLPKWWQKNTALSSSGSGDIFRCVNFSIYPPYDKKITTLSHTNDHIHILYPKKERNPIEKFRDTYTSRHRAPSEIIIVPSLSIGQETVEIQHIQEKNIEIIPYITLKPGKCDTRILVQLSITDKYWIYDGSYGSESGIEHLLRGYHQYREMGGTHMLLLLGGDISSELRNITRTIQELGLTGTVRIIGAIDREDTETLYKNASGWIYVGAYYASGPRIELARSYQIPLLISDLTSLSDYPEAIRIHPNHLSNLGQYIKDLEGIQQQESRKISNNTIMNTYERLISEKR